MKNKKHNKLHKYNRTLCSVALSSALAVVAVGSALPVVVQASDNVGVTATTGRTLYLSETSAGVSGGANHFTDLKRALEAANPGDTIVLKSNFLHREEGTEGLQITKDIAIDGQNSYTLTVRASRDKGIDMHGNLTLKDLTLNISESGALGGVIDVGGHHLKVENVSTKVYGTTTNPRPKIKADSGDNTRITIVGGTEETRFDSISLGSNVANIEITSDYSPIDEEIALGSSTNVNLSLSKAKNVKITGNEGGLNNLVIDGTKIVFQRNINIGILELKNGAKFDVKSIPDLEDYGNDTNFNVKVNTLKTDGEANTLNIAGSSSININNVDGDISGLTVEGDKHNFHLATNETHDYNSSNGTFTPKKKEESSNTSDSNLGTSSSASDPEGDPSATGESGLDNTNGAGTTIGGDHDGADGENTTVDGAGGANVDTEENQGEENQGGTSSSTGGKTESTSEAGPVTGESEEHPSGTSPVVTPSSSEEESEDKKEENTEAPRKLGETAEVVGNGDQEPPLSTQPTDGEAHEQPTGQPQPPAVDASAPSPAPAEPPKETETEMKPVQPDGGQNPPSEEGNKEEEETGPKTDTPAASPDKTGDAVDPNSVSPKDPDTSHGSQELPKPNGGEQVPPNEEQPAVTGSNVPAVVSPNTNNNAETAGSEISTDPASATDGKPEMPATTDDEPQGDDPNANGSAGANNNADVTKPVTPAQPSEKPAEKPAAKPTETPKEKPAEKSIKERIMDTLKGLFTENNLDEKQQQSAVEKTAESLNDLAATYTDYDFSLSIDAARVAENRLNDLAALNGLESAANDNYAFLAQSAKVLKTHNSVWVSSSLAEQRGDRDSKRRLSTINLGYDRQFDNLIVGGFVSYLRQKGERGELSSKLHGYSLSLYGKYSQNAHEVVALLNVGRTKADLQRNISALSVSNNAETKGKFVGLRAEYGYRMVFEQHGLQVKPIVALNYNLGRQAAFTESGTMPVHVGKIKAQRLALEAGVELKKYFENAYVYLKPTVQTDLMARSNDVDVRFVDTPNSIPFKSTAKKKTYFALSLGTQVQLRKDLLLDLNANSRIGNHERDIQGSVKLSYKF